MTRPGRADDRKLDTLHERNLEIAAFLESIGVAPEVVVLLREAIESAHARRDVRGLELVSHDLLEWAGTLTPDSQRALDARLRDRFSLGLFDDFAAADRAVADILTRGEISNASEYYLVRSVADNLGPSSLGGFDREAMDRLLAAYTRLNKPEP